ncbi:ferritin-like domain-containing protein [Alkalicella caledoniensis]|uniref:Ferritin-like domain-containing protein n=1 Tax=Alkalicella caledoniensis TaxID=2731377 RepID=A0A7G9W4N1_ALKCA|nr:ferritin-like domain-containing protein [Alkalicella caledoniensis]QNO13643.1 ferritin-like domain-containing protein [Alkalicella caledoniensis]
MKSSLKKLNNLLAEEYSMINSFDSYLNSIPDGEDKEELTTIMMNHEHNASQLRSQIEALGGRPKDSVASSNESMNIQSGSDRTVIEKVLKQAHQQERSTVELAQEITRTKIDEDTKYVIQEIVDVNRTHLATIDRLLKRHNA